MPLALYYFIDKQAASGHRPHGDADHATSRTPAARPTARRAGRRAAARSRDERNDPSADEPQPHEIIDALAADDMLPAIYFLFSRADCQAYRRAARA